MKTIMTNIIRMTKMPFGVAVFVVVLLLSITLFSQTTFAVFNIASFDTLLQNAYTSAKQGGGLKNLPGSMEKGNIYDQAYQVAQEQSTTSLVEAIDHTTHALNSLTFDQTADDVPGCDMEFSDTLALLHQEPSIGSEIRRELGNSISVNSQSLYEEFRTSCEKLFACYKVDEITARKQLEYCKNVAADAYYMGKIHSNTLNSLTTANNGDNIYADNRLDNSSFDILVDIQKIGDVLFEGNKEPAEILFYKFPTVNLPGSPAEPFGPSLSAIGFGGTSQLPGQGTGGAGSTGDVTTGTGGVPTSDAGGNDDQQQINEFINETNTSNPLPANPTDGPVINNHVCLVPDLTEEDLTEQQVTAAQIDAFLEDLFTQYDDLVNDPLADPSPISAAFGDGSADGIANDIDTNRAVEDAQRKRQCKRECEENLDPNLAEADKAWSLDICESQCCINICSELPPADQIVCTTDCLCGEVASPNNMFRMKFCKIPAQGVSAVPKHVQSIEEIVTELSNIVKVLQQNGEPLKTKKTKEFFDSTLGDIDFGSVFFFDVFVKIKPIFEEIPESVVEAQLEKEKRVTDRDILNVGTLDDPYERNKYVMIDESAITDGSKTVKSNLNQLRKNVDEGYADTLEYLNEQAYIIQQRQASLEQQALLESTSQVSEEMALFLKDNMKFWEQVTDTLGAMNLSAKTLADKIEKEE